MKINIPEVSLPRVVIVGGGFGGLALARNLKNKGFQIVLIDKNNYHTFQPLLYQVATAGLEPDSIAFPLRKIFKKHEHFYFRMAEVTRVDASKKQLHTNIGVVNYDYLVVATGSRTNYFGMADMEAESMPMKSIPEALNLRSLILQNFEKALLTSSLERQRSLMTFVIIGGGPTGVELAGALGELKKHVLNKDYPDLDLRKMEIHLIEANERLLAGMDKQSSAKAHEYLRELGVNVWLSTSVKQTHDNEVLTNTDMTFKSDTIVWTAGVVGATLPGLEAAEVKGGRLRVDEFNQVAGAPCVFAIGDVAAMITDANPKGHPMLAPVAIQHGELLADNLQRLQQGKALKPFAYNNKGSMATIGRNRAVVELPGFRFQGLFAWYVWMFVHLITLVGFKNRLVVLVNWVWNYVNYDRGVRLIIRPFKKATRKAATKPQEAVVK